MEQDIKNELNNRKEILNNHLAKFNQLKEEKKFTEAWNQLRITLNYANETLKYSANLLKNISQTTMPHLNTKNIDKVIKTIDEKNTAINSGSTTTTKKMIVIPKKQTIN